MERRTQITTFKDGELSNSQAFLEIEMGGDTYAGSGTLNIKGLIT